MKVLISYEQIFKNPGFLPPDIERFEKMFNIKRSDEILAVFEDYVYYPLEYINSGKVLGEKKMLWYLPECGTEKF
jgi:hypothetical protein